jgi:hypothetical protein
MMAQQSYGNHPTRVRRDDPEDYGKILEAFDEFGNGPRVSTSRRHSTGSGRISGGSGHRKSSSKDTKSHNTKRRIASSQNLSSREASVDANSRSNLTRAQRKSNRSVPTTASSDDMTASDDDASPPPAQDGVDLKVRNRALIHENRRMYDLIEVYEKRLKISEGLETGDSVHTKDTKELKDLEDDDEQEESVSRLKGKIRYLKTKRKHEKLHFMQMQKTIETQTLEIEGLQKELNRTMTELEKAQKERQGDKSSIHFLGKQLTEVEHQLHHRADTEVMAQLKNDLTKRDGELEVTLELLQGKVERIIQLECNVEKNKDQLAKAERRVQDLMSNGANGGNATSFQSMELLSADAEIKSLRRQNMMLKLVVEELQEARKRRSNSDIDIDSVFLKLPSEIQQEIPRSVGLGPLSLAGEDEGSVETDMLSFDTSVGMQGMPLPDPNHPFRR